MVGQKLGHNRIVEKIGEGGMGAVYRAEDEHLGRSVAIKILPGGALTDESARRRFRKEAQALSKLSHANIELVYDFDTQDGIDFLVMEYVDGLTLRQILANGMLAEREICRLGAQIVEGLEAAHEKGIVHCDLKPGNVMVSADGHVKILDFGLARLAHPEPNNQSTDSSSQPSRGGGTLPYMAPEQLTGEAVDRRTDIYALGNLFYEMATGRLPFQEPLSTALTMEIVHKPPPPPGRLRPDLSTRFEEIILKCLEKDPENRYQSAKEILVDIRRSSSSDAYHPLVEPGPKRTWLTWKSALISALIAAVALLAIRFWPWRGEAEPVPFYDPQRIVGTSYWEGEPAISPDGNWIAYSSDEFGSRDIFVTDLRGGQMRRLTDNPASDSGPAWFPDGSIAFTSDRRGTPGIWKVGLLGGNAIPLVEDAGQPAVSMDGSRIAFVREAPPDTYQLVIAPIADPTDAKVLVPANGEGWAYLDPAWSPDGRTICYAGRLNLWTVAAAGGEPRQLTFDNERDFEPVWSPDGRHVYFTSSRSGSRAIWRVNTRGGIPERVTSGTTLEGHPDISRDGKLLLHASNVGNRETFLLDRATGQQQPLPGTDWSVAALSPDMSKIVFVWNRGASDINLWIQPLANGSPAGSAYPLTSDADFASLPAFSPDGKWIAYAASQKGESDIWVVASTGGRRIRFTEHPGFDGHPAWSPDGGHIAFASRRSGSFQIWSEPIRDGKPVGTAQMITKGEFTAYFPSWSPDSRRIAFLGKTDSQYDIWSVIADGSAVAQQLTHGCKIRHLHWTSGTGELLASGAWGGDRIILCIVTPETGASRPVQPPVVFGSKDGAALFDVSPDGTHVLVTRDDSRGDIWLLRTRGSSF